MQYRSEKKFFFITTNGHSASKWVAKTLNLHKDIVCSHSPAKIQLSMAHENEYSDDEMEQIMADEYRKKISVDILLDELVEIENAKCYGNVHLFNLRQLQENLNNNTPVKYFRVVDLVRHPVSFVHSGTYNMIRQAKHNKNRKKYLINVYHRNMKLYNDFSLNHSIDLNRLDTLAFMANVMTFKSLTINMQIQNVDQRIRMEDITTSREKYRSLVNLISDGKVKADAQYLDAVFGTMATNKHKPSNKSTRVEEIYNRWDQWKKEFFDLLVEMTEIDKYYSTFGYDLSFLKKRNLSAIP